MVTKKAIKLELGRGENAEIDSQAIKAWFFFASYDNILLCTVIYL